MRQGKYDKIIRAIWQKEIKTINNHLPKIKKSFKELLEAQSPFIPTRNGGKLYLNKSELIELSKLLNENEKNQLKLPIVFIRRFDLGTGVYSLSGGKNEIDLIRKILKTLNIESQISYANPYIYKPVLSLIKKRFRTIILIGFGGASITD
ncbi:MAG: DUF61 family protein [Candidatus Odinarchaeia archaeon]